MLSKNNRGLRLQKYSDRKQRFTIKRFSVGVASVLIGTTFMMYGSASADQVSSLKSGEASSVVTQDNSQPNSGLETGNQEATTAETATVTKETPSVNSIQEETSVDSVSQDTETSVTTKEVSSQNASEESTFTQLNTKQLSTSVDTSATDEVATNQLSASLLAATPTSVVTSNRSMGTTDTGGVKNYTFDNLAFNFDNLSDASVKAGNDINFRISTYQKGANSGSNWQIRLQLDSTIAEQVSSIKAHPYRLIKRPNEWVYFERQAGTNIWAAPYIRANGGIFGGADLGAYTVDGVIELKDTVGNVIANDNNNIPYRAYVYDQHNQAPISSSITEGYFNTLPEPQISNDTTRLNKFKTLSASSQVRFDPTVGEYGAFIVDETILKNGALALDMQYNLDDTQYHINIDPELVDKFENPEYYIGRYDFGGPGFIPTYFEEDYRATTSFNDQGQAYFDIPDTTASLGNSTSKNEYLNVNGAQNPIIVRTVLKLKQSAYDLMTTDASGEPVFLIPKDSAILPVELYFSDNNGGMFPTTYTTGGLLAQELPTNVDANVKPVLPTGDKQDTGIKVEYATNKTTITATDANGNDVPVEKDEKTGEVYVSTKGAKGPIKVTVSDPSMITNVDGVKTGEFTANVPVVVIPEKTPVANVSELTDKEKQEVEDKVKEANKDVFPDPDNTTVTVGNDGTATITYPDKSTQTIPGSDLVRLAPQGKDVTVEKGKTPEAKQGIANEKDLPEGTTYEWKTPVDTSTPGKTEGTVEVTYPDGTKDEVTVPVHVTDPRSDADKNTPEPKPIDANVGDKPNAADGIGNKGDMPEGTKYGWKDGQTPDTTTPGDKKGTVEVTYPDGSKDEVPVDVHVTDPRTDADKNTPEPKPIDANVGDKPNAADGIGNKGDMPEGTKYGWKDGQAPDTTTPGDKKGTVEVTYPDGSKDEVPVDVHVTDPHTDADKNTPEPKPIDANVGDKPNAADGIGNKGDMPEGTKYGWKDGQTPDTTTPGDKKGTVEVTYPDGSKDEVPVDVHVTDPRTDADKNTPEPKPIDANVGDKPNAADGIGNKGDMPEGTKYGWKDGQTPDTTTPGDKKGTVEVTYPDGSKDEVPVDVHVTDPHTDADKNTPEPKPIDANVGDKPNAADGIGNKGDMPEGTKYGWKDGQAPDTTTPGDKKGTVEVTYPDGSKDEVPVDVHVTDPRTDADKNTPEPKPIDANVGDKPNAADGIGNKGDMPEGTKYGWKDGQAPDTTTPGDKKGTVEVTYPDGSKDEVPVDVHVTDPHTDADKNTPEPKPIDANVGDKPNAADGIGNKGDMPEGTKYGWKDGQTPDTTTPGDKKGTVEVTYPDGSKDEVPVDVHVTDPHTDADKNTPEPKPIDANVGDKPNAADGIGNKGDMPEGTKYGWKDGQAPDTTTPGDKKGTVEVTYPDGSKDEVPVDVHVTDPRTDADKNTPEPKPIDANVGDKPNAADGIGNKGDMPEGTKYGWKDGQTPDTTTPGDKKGTVEVTYPDGSKDEVPVDVHVTDPRTDADKNTPEPKPIDANVGDKPNAADGIGNKGDMPEGTKYGWKDGQAPDTTTPGDKKGTVEVTYPDGSKDEVPVDVHVTDPHTDADKNTPEPKPIDANVGDKPNAADGIGNKGDMPEGTKYGWKDGQTPDTTTPGDKKGTVEVTYPDGSKDEVPVDVHVTDPRTDADKNTPEPKPIDANVGDKPNAADGIGNKGDMPEGTKYGWKDGQTPDTTTPGDKKGTVEVTYPDGSKDEVPVDVHVTDPHTDADKNTPEPKPIDANVGDKPNAADGIGNKGDMPEGTKYGWKDGQAPDTTTPGDKKGTVEVTYPDGSKDEVPVDVHVTDPRTDADKNTPEPKPIDANVGDKPNAADGIGNKGDMPEGTKYGWKDGQAPDTTTPGDKKGTVEVTYPDGSKDEVPVDVHVTDPHTDADKNTPEPKPIDANVGDKPNAADGIGNKGDMPEGTKYGWKDGQTPDTTTPGDKKGTVEVTYPDGSKDEVPVDVHVTDPHTDADKNTPEPKPIDANVGDKPNAADGIGNKGDMPAGTKYEWKDGETPDTTTPGIKEGTIEVTYPDGTKEEVPVKVHVIEQSVPGDAPSYDLPSLPIADVITPLIPDKTPVHDTTSLTDGEKAEVTGKVTEVNNFPEGTKVEVDNDGTATITYPDGSQDTIPGTDLVTETVTGGVTPSETDKPEPNAPAKPPVKDATGSTDGEKKADTSDKVVINVANKPVVQPEEKAKVAVNASKELPQTGETHADESALGLVALAAAGVLSFMGLGKKRED